MATKTTKKVSKEGQLQVPTCYAKWNVYAGTGNSEDEPERAEQTSSFLPTSKPAVRKTEIEY